MGQSRTHVPLTASAFFVENKLGKTGLAPTVDVHRVGEAGLLVTDGAAVERGRGWYGHCISRRQLTKQTLEVSP